MSRAAAAYIEFQLPEDPKDLQRLIDETLNAPIQTELPKICQQFIRVTKLWASMDVFSDPRVEGLITSADGLRDRMSKRGRTVDDIAALAAALLAEDKGKSYRRPDDQVACLMRLVVRGVRQLASQEAKDAFDAELVPFKRRKRARKSPDLVAA